MLNRVKKAALTRLKMMTSTTSPSIAGRAPGSPERRRPTYDEKALPSVFSSMSREKLLGRSPGTEAVGVEVFSDMTRSSDVRVGRGGRQPDVPTASGRDQLHDLRRRAVGGLHLGGDPPQVEGDHPVCHLHDVVHVVGDQHDSPTLVREPAYQVQDLAGL